MSSSRRTAIASMKLLAIDATGREFELTIAIGEPYEVSPAEWACPASMDGLHRPFRDITGIDSWQALHLASRLIAQMLVYFVEDGGRLLWFETREPLELDVLFPQPTLHS